MQESSAKNKIQKFGYKKLPANEWMQKNDLLPQPRKE